MDIKPLSNQNHFEKIYFFASLLILTLFSVFPLLIDMPYRINIYLSWEGSYRLYLGQIPYKDFGIPMGYAYWLIPAFFFKIFGPLLHTLVKAQVFINFVSGLAFWSILKSFNLRKEVILFSILIFCISYIFINFWPWYNHTVIVFQFLAISSLLKFVFSNQKYSWMYLILGSFFCFLSIFTKQDGGGMAFIICLSILVVDAFQESRIKGILFFLVGFLLFSGIFVLPFINKDILYWFNYGQPPHYSRISIHDFLKDILGGSPGIKFYILIIVLLLFNKFNSFTSFYQDKKTFIFATLTFGILGEAFIYQVTSYVPFGNNIFFHSFAVAFIFSLIIKKNNHFSVIVVSILILFWWSVAYWKYIDRIIISNILPKNEQLEEVISKNTYVQKEDNVGKKFSKWIKSDMKVFHKVTMPEETLKGIERVKKLPILQNSPINSLKVLNMTELTPLAYEIGYIPLKNQPLWYHKGVAIFNKEINIICDKIINNDYDLVMFEKIPALNNFYPEEIRECLHENYLLIDSFPAPRSREEAFIEIFVRK